MSITLIYDTLLLEILFFRYGMRCETVAKILSFGFVIEKEVGFRTRNASWKKGDSHPLPSQYLAINCMGRQSLTHPVVIARDWGAVLDPCKCGKCQFFRKFWNHPWIFYIVLYVSSTCFIKKYLKILKIQDSLSPACKPILAKNPLKNILYIWYTVRLG